MPSMQIQNKSALSEMLQEKSSYIRTRAFILICNQARWVNDGQIEAVFDQMLPLLNDPKPTVVRQCLEALHEVVLYRPELADRIEKGVAEIAPGKYKDSMSSLIEKDIAALRKLLYCNNQAVTCVKDYVLPEQIKIIHPQSTGTR